MEVLLLSEQLGRFYWIGSNGKIVLALAIHDASLMYSKNSYISQPSSFNYCLANILMNPWFALIIPDLHIKRRSLVGFAFSVSLGSARDSLFICKSRRFPPPRNWGRHLLGEELKGPIPYPLFPVLQIFFSRKVFESVSAMFRRPHRRSVWNIASAGCLQHDSGSIVSLWTSKTSNKSLHQRAWSINPSPPLSLNSIRSLDFVSKYTTIATEQIHANQR